MTFHNYKKPINVTQDLIFVKIYFRDIYFCGRPFSFISYGCFCT